MDATCVVRRNFSKKSYHTYQFILTFYYKNVTKMRKYKNTKYSSKQLATVIPVFFILQLIGLFLHDFLFPLSFFFSERSIFDEISEIIGGWWWWWWWWKVRLIFSLMQWLIIHTFHEEWERISTLKPVLIHFTLYVSFDESLNLYSN